jgi:hypothetical protein
VSAEDLEPFELLILVLHLLLNQLYVVEKTALLTFDELFECMLAGLRDKWFLQENLVNQSVNVGPTPRLVHGARILTQGSGSTDRCTKLRILP